MIVGRVLCLLIPVFAGPPVKPSTPACGGCTVERLRPAFLTIDGRPGTKVNLDGEPFGVIPLVKVRISPGHHTVTLTDEDGRSRTTAIDARAGETTRLSFDTSDAGP